LKVIQQPERARACGAGAKSSADRRPVDPPPVVELKIFEVVGRDPKADPDITFAYNANFFLFATLETARPMHHGRVAPPQLQQTPVLTGMPVSGMAYLDRPSEAGYFIFPDLSVRHEGKYRLSFNLYEETKEPREDADQDSLVEGKRQAQGAQRDPDAAFDWRMELKSDVFDVFSAKKFPGLAESTPLSRTVAEQGCRVRIRRDVRMRRREGKGGDFEGEEQQQQFERARLSEPRSRSSSISENGRASFDQSHLSFGPPQHQQPQFATPQTPLPPQYEAPAYRQAPYGPPAPPPPPSHQVGYDRSYPPSAYPSHPPREVPREDDAWRRAASVAAHASEPFPRHYPGPEQNFHRNPPTYYSNVPPSPAPSNLPPLRHHSGKYERPAPTAQLPPVRSIAPALTAYERRDERPPHYPQYHAPLAAALVAEPAPELEPARNGKRTFDTTFGSASYKEPLYNGMRPTTPHDDADEDDEEAEAALMKQMMSYKRADGARQTRALPRID